MPILTDRPTAMAQLVVTVQADLEPLLDYGTPGDELETILDNAQLASIWVASTDYDYGAVVIPTAAKRNGHRYQLVRFDGIDVSSGATEPDWPTGRDAQISDGNIIWQEAGADYDSLWDMRTAAYFGWLAKAGKVPTSSSASANAGLKKFSEDGQSFEFEGSSGHTSDRQYFLDMAMRYQPVEVG